MLHLPPLDDMASRWKLDTIDRRQVGDDMRLLMRPSAP
jgi:diaminohydroxyphosphoribosylaminopyrimidine deaminase/5-amino-6-(5-phosphoribosylamino)uracil reductase